VQYSGLQGGGALGDASTPSTPAGTMAASTHVGTYTHAAGAWGAWGEERGACGITNVGSITCVLRPTVAKQ